MGQGSNVCADQEMLLIKRIFQVVCAPQLPEKNRGRLYVPRKQTGCNSTPQIPQHLLPDNRMDS